MRSLTRRAVALGGLGASASLAGCAAMQDMPVFGTLIQKWPVEGAGPVRAPDYAKVYGKREGERHAVPAFDYTILDPTFLRADVAYAGQEPAGSIVIDPRRHQLFLVEVGGRATRYGIAVGPESRGFVGGGTVAAMRRWPDYAPSPAIVTARPFVAWAQFGNERAYTAPAAPTIAGGPRSPRGARALYLAAGGRDAGYVVHGTPDPATVGTDVQTGCIALINQDAMDLFGRVRDGTPVVVLA